MTKMVVEKMSHKDSEQTRLLKKKQVAVEIIGIIVPWRSLELLKPGWALLAGTLKGEYCVLGYSLVHQDREERVGEA